MAQFILGTPGAQFMSGISRGPVYVWEYHQGPRSWLGVLEVQFMFEKSSGAVHVWECQLPGSWLGASQGPVYVLDCPGPSLYSGMPGTQFMFGNARGRVYV